MSHVPFDEGMTPLEVALKQLQPAAALQRDRLMFAAGRASAPRRGWLWPAAAVAATCAAGYFAIGLWSQPAPQEQTRPVVVERVVFVPVVVPVPLAEGSKPTAVSEPPARTTLPAIPSHHPTAYWQMEKQALRWGVDHLPAPSEVTAPQSPQTLHAWMNAMNKGQKGRAFAP